MVFAEHVLDALRPSVSITMRRSGIGRGYMKHGIQAIDTYYSYFDPKWKFSPYHRLHVDNTLRGFVKDGLLYRGVLDTRRRISTLGVLKVVTQYLFQAWKYGTINCDLIAYDVLLMVLLCATGARIGDLVRSEGYEGVEYVTWKNVTLKVPVGATTLQEALLRIELPFTKGKK